MEEFSGRVAVVTGAASGIGLALCERFGREGMRVVLADIERAALDSAAEKLRSDGVEALAVPTDVESYDAVAELADAAFARFGAVHVLCNNAGVVTAGPVESLSLADWHWVLGVNLWGCIHGVKAFLPRMLEQTEGHVVSTASVAGLYSPPTIAAYNVSKFGVVALMETLYRELVARGSPIGASVLCPGSVDTRLLESERNRPAESARQHQRTRAEDAFLQVSRTMLSAGLAPAKVADCVVDAIRARRFWILPHSGIKQTLLERVEALAKDEQLV